MATKKFLAVKANFDQKIEKLKNRQAKVLTKMYKLVDGKKLDTTYKKIKAIKK